MGRNVHMANCPRGEKSINPLPLSPVYTIQTVVKLVVKRAWQPVECLYTRYNRLSNRLYKPFWQPVERTVAVSGCSLNTVVKPVVQPVWQSVWQPVGCLFTRYSRLSNRLYNRLYRVNGVLHSPSDATARLRDLGLFLNENRSYFLKI